MWKNTVEPDMPQMTIWRMCFACNITRATDIHSEQWLTQEFCSGGGGSTNSIQDRGQRERGSGGGSPLVRGSGCNLV